MEIIGTYYPQNTRLRYWVIFIANVLVLQAPILSLLILGQGLIFPYVPLPVFFEIKAVLPILLIVSYSFYFPALLFSNVRFVIKTISGMIMCPIICLAVVFMLDTEYLLNSVQAGSNRYHLTVAHQITDNISTCFLYECASNNLKCEKIESCRANCWGVRKSDLVVNHATNEVNVFIDDFWGSYHLDYTYGNQPRHYMDKLQVGDFDYYIAYFHEYSTHPVVFRYMFYQCEKDDIACERLPFQYDLSWRPWGSLELDEISGDIRIKIDGELIFTYSDTPKCHVEDCYVTNE